MCGNSCGSCESHFRHLLTNPPVLAACTLGLVNHVHKQSPFDPQLHHFLRAYKLCLVYSHLVSESVSETWILLELLTYSSGFMTCG